MLLLRSLIKSDIGPVAYQNVSIPMTLSDLQGHALNAGLLSAIYRTVLQQLTSLISTGIARRAVPLRYVSVYVTN